MKKLLLIVMCIITGLFMVSCGSSSDSESSKVTKLDLKYANSNAKLVFSTLNNYLVDLLVENDYDVEKITKIVNESCNNKITAISDLKKSNNLIDKKLYDSLKSENADEGYIYIDIYAEEPKHYSDGLCAAIDPEIKLAQWSEGGSCVGQYPNPEMDKNAEHEIGEQFTPEKSRDEDRV